MAKDPRLTRLGLDKYNQAKRTPKHPTSSHVVVAKEGDKVKTIRFGQQGVSGSPKRENVMLKTLRKAKCLLHTGQIKLNGKRLLCIKTKKRNVSQEVSNG